MEQKRRMHGPRSYRLVCSWYIWTGVQRRTSSSILHTCINTHGQYISPVYSKYKCMHTKYCKYFCGLYNLCLPNLGWNLQNLPLSQYLLGMSRWIQRRLGTAWGVGGRSQATEGTRGISRWCHPAQACGRSGHQTCGQSPATRVQQVLGIPGIKMLVL